MLFSEKSILIKSGNLLAELTNNLNVLSSIYDFFITKKTTCSHTTDVKSFISILKNPTYYSLKP